MPDLTSNHKELSPSNERSDPDPHGQAAMLLVESLIHGLIARSALTVSDAVEIVRVAEVKEQTASELGESPAALRSLTLLEAVEASLSLDLRNI